MKRKSGFYKNFIAWFLITCLLTAALCACGSEQSSDGDENSYYVYYSNSSADSIKYRTYVLSESSRTDLEAAVNELLNEMFSTDYTESGYYSAKPDSVEDPEIGISDEGLLSLYFGEDYLSMSLVQEIILRSSVVLTIIQLEGIDEIEFFVNGESVTDSEGNAIGAMDAEDFVDVLLNEESMLQQTEVLTIMFANEDGTMLVPVNYTFEISSNMSLEEYVLTQLIAGPAEDVDAYPTISPEVELIGVSTTNHVCYVNFAENFLEQETQYVSDTLLIYSIVNSLCDITNVHSVQFLIDGNPATTLHQVTDISTQFTRDRSLEAAY